VKAGEAAAIAAFFVGKRPVPVGCPSAGVSAVTPPAQRAGDWLPAPKGADFSLYIRSYRPKVDITDGSWTPPAVVRANLDISDEIYDAVGSIVGFVGPSHLCWFCGLCSSVPRVVMASSMRDCW
jgi:hypothetical protein